MINNVKLDPIANKGMVFLKTGSFSTQRWTLQCKHSTLDSCLYCDLESFSLLCLVLQTTHSSFLAAWTGQCPSLTSIRHTSLTVFGHSFFGSEKNQSILQQVQYETGESLSSCDPFKRVQVVWYASQEWRHSKLNTWSHGTTLSSTVSSNAYQLCSIQSFDHLCLHLSCIADNLVAKGGK